VVGVQLARRLTGRGVRTIGYSLSRAAIAPGSVQEFVCASSIRDSEIEIESSWGRAGAKINLVGRFNTSNALGVLGCLLSYGISLEEGAGLLGALPPVPGRMEKIGDRPLVVIDYAHTPDALEKVLQALRPIADSRAGRLIVVFGAGGDRDATKRPVMGAVAGRLADQVVITSDNPRSEDPLSIMSQIEKGIPGAHHSEADRGRAIEKSILSAASADVVLVAGKGHENYQEIGGRRLPFSDAAAARAAMAKRSRA
jgi:UDP-N-acetylmuramoyl-L-alanyl-D-glutamate--2,6-diaminopimelate ligase